MLLCILLYKKQRLPGKYLLQLYSNCCYAEQWQNVAISSTTWRRARSVLVSQAAVFRGEASRISPAAFEAVHVPVGNTHGTKRLAKPTQLQQHGARDPLKKMALQCCYDEDAS